MKNVVIYAILILCSLLSFSSCTNDLVDEQFQKMVLLTDNGLVDYDIDYTDEGTVLLNLPVSINGTSKNSQDVTASLALAPDTLSKYNFERYRNRTALYYQLADENMYSFPSGPSATIKAGDDYAIVPLQLNLSNFDFYKNYILPIKVANTSSYSVANSKYSTLLMRLNISNFFSGTYSVNGNVWEDSNSGQKLSISSASLYALSSNTCYLYTGSVTESDEDRSGYTLTVSVDKNIFTDSEEASTGAQIRKYTKLTIGSKDTDKKVTDISNNGSYVSVSKLEDAVNKNLENVITKIYLKYSYMNLRDASYPVKMVFEGTFTKSVSIDKRTGKPKK